MDINLPINMFDPTRDYNANQDNYDNAIKSVLQHGRFINGPEVKQLEKELATYVGVSDCICVGNGTDALQIALMALDIGNGDEVITVAHTWISSSEVISLVGAKPVFVDIEDNTFNIDITKIESAITKHTKAILVVNLYGQIPDYEKIWVIAKKYNLYIIEDGAQSFGARRYNKKSCSFGTISTTSFFPTKPLGCYGDGGACFTNDMDLGMKIRAIKNHGGSKRFHHDYIGVNSRLDSIQAAVLLVKCHNFEDSLKKRNIVASKYSEELKSLQDSNLLKLPVIEECNYHVWAQYSVIMNSKVDRDRLFNKLCDNGVNVSIFYPKPLHYQKCFEYLGYKESDLPVTEKVCDTIINLPCYSEFKRDEQEYVIKIINDHFS